MSQNGFVLILGCEDGICEVAIYVTPFAKTTIVEELEIVCDNKGDNGVGQTFFKSQKYTPSFIYQQVKEPNSAENIHIFADTGKKIHKNLHSVTVVTVFLSKKQSSPSIFIIIVVYSIEKCCSLFLNCHNCHNPCWDCTEPKVSTFYRIIAALGLTVELTPAV